jgi:hypothetical protein
VHWLFGKQDQSGSAYIAALDPATAASPPSEGMIMAAEAVPVAVSSVVVHLCNLLLLKTLSQYHSIYRDATNMAGDDA